MLSTHSTSHRSLWAESPHTALSLGHNMPLVIMPEDNIPELYPHSLSHRKSEQHEHTLSRFGADMRKTKKVKCSRFAFLFNRVDNKS